MVAMCNIEDEYAQKNPKTLGDWVKNFRLKKMQMKRKLRSGGAELRVCAILSTALITAELELRRKQQERFQKWLEFQSKINKNDDLQPREEHHHQSQEEDMIMVASDEKRCKESEEITNLWKCELSELDNFMRSISSRNNQNQITDDSGGCRIQSANHQQEQGFQPLTSHHSIQVSS